MNSILYQNSLIEFGDLTQSSLDSLLRSDKYRKAKKIIITDENVFELWLPFFITHFDALAEAEIIQVPAGEESKSIEICTHIWEALSEYEIKRNDLIINIGGGMVTDMGGFIASTFKRGIDFINIPTTLLAQVDASIGGKTGINLGVLKNQIGSFSNPTAVYIDSNFLSTLTKEELLSGYGEMLKHGLIADNNYWQQLKNLDLNPSSDLEEAIKKSVLLKKDIVERDPKEEGERKCLNFGHTIGHALEGVLLREGRHFPHGICIAWGMLAEAYLSMKASNLEQSAFEEIKTLIQLKFPPIMLSLGASNELIALMKNDKKNSTAEINFTLLARIGKANYNKYVQSADLEEAIRFILHPLK